MALVCHSWTDALSGPAARMRWWERRRRRNRSARRCRASFGPEGGAVRRRDWRGNFGQHQWRWESSPLHLPGSQVLLSGARLRWRLEPLPRQHRTRVSTRSLSPFNAHAASNLAGVLFSYWKTKHFLSPQVSMPLMMWCTRMRRASGWQTWPIILHFRKRLIKRHQRMLLSHRARRLSRQVCIHSLLECGTCNSFF